MNLPSLLLFKVFWDFPGGPVVGTLPSNAGSEGLNPGRGAKISHASRPKNQNIKQKQYCNKFNKDFKNGPHQKKKNLKKKPTMAHIFIYWLNVLFLQIFCINHLCFCLIGL